jgi:CRISPR system Cascade subunit CasC
MLRAAIGSAVDVALAGRMATSGIMRPVDGALAVAHALTTHAVEPQDVDWFTAVDDLIEEAGETGAGHLNTQQFSAGVFYRYASLNLKQLQVNLGLLAGMHSAETPESRTRALAIARHVLHMLATVVPTAKQQSHAAHNPAELAIVSFADLPVSLANASERPVERAREGGYLGPSMLLIADYWQRLDTAYGLDERAAAFCFDDTPWQDEARREKGRRWPEKLPRYLQLGELERWIENDGQP